MARCQNCSTKFSFFNLLKSSTPWTIRCSSCSAKIETGNLSTLIVVALLIAICLLLFVLLTGAGVSVLFTIIVLFVVTFFVELAWYKLIISGFIKSNLAID